MTVDFYKSHIETLCELKELAYKHNCSIAFGVRNDSNPELNFDDCDEIFPENILEDLKRCGDIVKGYRNATYLWFELYDRNTCRYHNMTYVDGDYYIEYDRFYFEEVEEETQNWIEENVADWSDPTDDHLTFCKSFGYTKSSGFNGAETPNVYRSGMALKFFGDLVCDYLGEDRIVRTY